MTHPLRSPLHFGFTLILVCTALGPTAYAAKKAKQCAVSASKGAPKTSPKVLDHEGLKDLLQVPRDLVHKYFITESEAAKVVPVKAGSTFYDLPKVLKGSVESFKLSDRMYIDKLAEDFDLTRLQAVEVQALLRRFTKMPNDEQLLKVIDAVRSGQTLSRLNNEKIKKAPFTLVLDIDGTLLDQDSVRFIHGLHESSFLVDGKKVHHVAVNKPVLNLIKQARDQGAAVVLFSRNNDLLIWEILESIQVGKKPLTALVDGVLTSSHMIMPQDAKSSSFGGASAFDLKKDLSLIPAQRIVLIDDDPSYVMQQHLMISVPKFEIKDVFSKTSGGDLSRFSSLEDDAPVKLKDLSKSERSRLSHIAETMEDAYKQVSLQLEYLTSNLSAFTEKQIVFSPLGEEALSLLTGSHSRYVIDEKMRMDSDKAIDYLIKNPKQVYAILKSKKKKEKEPLTPILGGSYLSRDRDFDGYGY